MSEELKPIIEVTKEIAKPAYEDGLQPVVKATGRALGTVMDVFNLILAPLERAQLASAAKTEAFRKSLREKYDKIPPEKRQEPDLKSVCQINDKLKYSINNDVLRGLFEDLLISSMTQGRIAHPLFIDVIDKMTTEDARLFRYIYSVLVSVLPDSPSAGLYLFELYLHQENIRGFFLGWFSNRILNGEDIYNGPYKEYFLFKLDESDLLIEIGDAALYSLDSLENLGLINRITQYLPHQNPQKFTLEDSLEIIYDSDLPPICKIAGRRDVLNWIERKCKSFGENTVWVDIVCKCVPTVFGKRLFEVLQSPDDTQEWQWNPEYDSRAILYD